jgi:hypothetical protein
MTAGHQGVVRRPRLRTATYAGLVDRWAYRVHAVHTRDQPEACRCPTCSARRSPTPRSRPSSAAAASGTSGHVRNLGLRRTEAPVTGALAFGTRIHECLERHYADGEDLLAVYEELHEAQCRALDGRYTATGVLDADAADKLAEGARAGPRDAHRLRRLVGRDRAGRGPGDRRRGDRGRGALGHPRGAAARQAGPEGPPGGRRRDPVPGLEDGGQPDLGSANVADQRADAVLHAAGDC